MLAIKVGVSNTVFASHGAGLAEGVISFVLAIQVGVSPYSLATVSLYLLALGDRTRNKLVINKLTGLE